jgi:hypothetical protein
MIIKFHRYLQEMYEKYRAPLILLLIYNYASLVPSMGVPDIAAVVSNYTVLHDSVVLIIVSCVSLILF